MLRNSLGCYITAQAIATRIFYYSSNVTGYRMHPVQMQKWIDFTKMDMNIEYIVKIAKLRKIASRDFKKLKENNCFFLWSFHFCSLLCN